MRTIPFLLLLFFIAVAQGALAEQRTEFSGSSPAWLQAVGKLRVPGSRVEDGYRKHKQEDCSGTLVSRAAGSQSADIVVTAWHCLEYYKDVSRPILFTLLPNTATPITLEARRVDDGGNMHSDWALLRLTEPVHATSVRGLAVHPGRADADREVLMAGYSGDAGLGRDGQVMTYHAGCQITEQARRESHSNCEAYKGASGGAVIQINRSGQALFSGVISRGDSESVSIFVPVEGFRTPLNLALH